MSLSNNDLKGRAKQFKKGDSVYIPWDKFYSFSDGYAKGQVVKKLSDDLYELKIDNWEFLAVYRAPQEINLYKEDEWEDI